MRSLLKLPGTVMERRLAYRFLADTSVTCRVPASPASARICDISTEGCRIHLHSGAVTPGGTILIELLAGFHAIGRVMWRKGTEAGVRFDQSLHQSVVDYVQAGAS